MNRENFCQFLKPNNMPNKPSWLYFCLVRALRVLVVMGGLGLLGALPAHADVPAVGTLAPDFTLPDQNGKPWRLQEMRGRWVVLYFYPKDDTPGCTTEACNFRDGYKEFKKMGLVILGVSKDGVKSHKKFAEKFKLPFPLLADTEHEVAEKYGVWKLKKFMGREYMGMERSSFLIDEEGKIAKVYETVKPDNHAEDVKGDVR